MAQLSCFSVTTISMKITIEFPFYCGAKMSPSKTKSCHEKARVLIVFQLLTILILQLMSRKSNS